jgi:hypothetical protein
LFTDINKRQNLPESFTGNWPLTTGNCIYESTGIGKKDLRQVQGHPPQGSSAGDLRQLET